MWMSCGRNSEDTTNNISEEIVGFKRSRQVKGLPEEVCKACEQRRKPRILMMNNPSAHNKKSYTKLNKAVKYEVKKWKRKILDTEVEEMELAPAMNNSHELFKKVKKLSGERDKMLPAIKNKDGILKTAPADVLKCWEVHFSVHLNTQFPRDENALLTIPDPQHTDNPSEPFTIEEVETAIQLLKNNKACGWDNQ